MGAWIEIALNSFSHTLSKSHPTMGAWIEIIILAIVFILIVKVAPHDGCVD